MTSLRNYDLIVKNGTDKNLINKILKPPNGGFYFCIKYFPEYKENNIVVIDQEILIDDDSSKSNVLLYSSKDKILVTGISPLFLILSSILSLTNFPIAIPLFSLVSTHYNIR